MLLVRHAWAGKAAAWSGDDRERPLDARGVSQAEKLSGLLERFEVEAIYTSPYLRCRQTVEPLAAVRGLVAEVRAELGADQQSGAGRELVRALAGRHVVVCGHGGLESAVLQGPPKWRKGETFVLDGELRVLETLRS
jgi:8-oxo-dGTP diphosphatase